jgi:hypothetical protein
VEQTYGNGVFHVEANSFVICRREEGATVGVYVSEMSGIGFAYVLAAYPGVQEIVFEGMPIDDEPVESDTLRHLVVHKVFEANVNGGHFAFPNLESLEVTAKPMSAGDVAVFLDRLQCDNIRSLTLTSEGVFTSVPHELRTALKNLLATHASLRKVYLNLDRLILPKRALRVASDGPVDVEIVEQVRRHRKPVQLQQQQLQPQVTFRSSRTVVDYDTESDSD